VQRHALLDFLFYGLPYAFAVQPGAPARGLATGASAPPLVQTFRAAPAYVWPGATGTQWGAPSSLCIPKPLLQLSRMRSSMACLPSLTDALRLGRLREVKLARHLLEQQVIASALIPAIHA
jgi:hypothetical protein